ncbi:hypothetical protein IV203_004372 [Nitzschia inconspicua]|uniref:Uncharacterized protein n=1 Tax=Nitzschia inconspicua TaxID=303405 RepID=A0A9K3PQ28_9STRA|nr:hypothetical protein IV203_004372 [Nitzschia inconspicua]
MKLSTKLFLLAVVATTASAQRCTTSEDCESGEEYCAANVCVPIGSCSQVFDCFNPANFPYPSLTCTGYMECSDDNLCGMVCGPESSCPDGGSRNECDPDNLPCDLEACDESVGCYNDPCGDGACTAVFYDAAGNIVCSQVENVTLPETLPPVETFDFPCNKDLDCDDAFNETTAYCSHGTCLPSGSCTMYEDCVNPSNSYAVIECLGAIQCFTSSGQCGRECGPSFCQDGVEEVDCFDDPCLNFETDCPIAASCVKNNCGECSAILFDDAGFVLEDCSGNSSVTLLEIPPPIDTFDVPCNMDLDCDGVFSETEAYCSHGICLPSGSCTMYEDCVNPSNSYMMIECVGPIQCSPSSGQCGRECGPSSCQDGVEEVNCIADPCLNYETNCPIAASCVSNYCGECSAILFDDAGYVLEDCNENTTGIFGGMTCSSDMDCGDNDYCADGICLKIGKCNERIDCFNPANGPYAVIACVGLLDCFEGSCSVACGPECPDGEEQATCPEDACNVTNCEEAVSCNFDGCGGECTEIFFDEAGTQVCVDNATLPLCTSDPDCTGIAIARDIADGMYCAQGVCMENGRCNDDLDCINPSNLYPALDCVGYRSCENGQCGVTCGPGCKDGSEWSLCETSPCENSTCAAATSCASDLCNGCNAIFFDAAGSEVESCDIVTFNTAMNPDSAFSIYSLYGVVVAAICGMTILLV